MERLAYKWFLDHGVRITLLLLAAIIVNNAGRVFIEKLIQRVVVRRRGDGEDLKKREDTLVKVFNATFKTLVWIMAIMMILSEVGINIGPLIAGAGVAGLALGIGGQFLIKDLISGLFIIMEGQYRIGDKVCLGDVCGSVVDINLRKTILKDEKGNVHHLANGSFSKVANHSQKT